ncbi:MAG: hypothetical protein R2729_12915 [Bryobacteraceae bacterium]
MGGAVAMQTAIRHPDKVRRAVIISSTFRSDGMVARGLDAISKLTADVFKDSRSARAILRCSSRAATSSARFS